MLQFFECHKQVKLKKKDVKSTKKFKKANSKQQNS